jgi:hypothetical protein
MNKYGNRTCLEVAEFYESVRSRYLNEQPRREQDEEHHRHKHRPPIRHLRLLAVSLFTPRSLLLKSTIMSGH